jgi:hypothetical protein
MFLDFFPYAAEHSSQLSSQAGASPVNKAVALAEALEHFGCKAEFERRTRAKQREKALSVVFTSTQVREWTGLQQGPDWRLIKRLMDATRSELGGEEGMLELERDVIRDTVLRLHPQIEKELRSAVPP